MSKVYSRQAKGQMKSVSFLQSIPTKHRFRNDLAVSVLRAQPHPIPCGVVLGATYFDSFRCQQNYWCWLPMLSRWHVRLLSSEGKSCMEGQCGFGDRENRWIKEAVRKGDYDGGGTQEVKRSVHGTGCEIWVPPCDLGREQ